MEIVTMTKDATFSSRIDSQLKEKGDSVLRSLGIKPSQALTMFYTQVVMYGGIPFEVKIPNEELIQAFKDGQNPQNLHHYLDAKSAIDDMWNNS